MLHLNDDTPSCFFYWHSLSNNAVQPASTSRHVSSKFPVNHGSATSCGVLVYDIRRRPCATGRSLQNEPYPAGCFDPLQPDNHRYHNPAVSSDAPFCLHRKWHGLPIFAERVDRPGCPLLPHWSQRRRFQIFLQYRLFSTRSFITNSAMGLRQIFPRQMNKIRVIFLSSFGQQYTIVGTVLGWAFPCSART